MSSAKVSAVFTSPSPSADTNADETAGQAGTARAPQASASSSGPALKILVLDDNRDAADTCAMFLQFSGHCVQTAYAGYQALEVAASFHPHAILADISLPDLDGYQLARAIRATTWGRSSMLIAVTGWVGQKDREQALEAGFDHHFAKPLDLDRIESLLHERAGMEAMR